MKITKFLTTNKLKVALIIGFVLTIITSQFAVFASDCESIRNNTLRLHILANSDTEQDQKLKLQVRDKILEQSGTLFAQANSKAMAQAELMDKLNDIEKICNDEINASGYNYTAKAEICNMYFTTRVYETFTLPAGYYDAVRVTIGEANGKNWWCVLYPSLCIPAVSKTKEIQMDTLTESQQDIIENSDKYEIRFASVELFYKLKNFFK